MADWADPWIALEVQQRVIELTDGAHARDWHVLGRLYEAVGEFDAAREHLETALAKAVDQDWLERCTIEDELARLRPPAAHAQASTTPPLAHPGAGQGPDPR